MSAIRRGRFKLVYDYERGDAALYDLAMDPGEHNDCTRDEPDRARDLQQCLDAWLERAPLLQPRRR